MYHTCCREPRLGFPFSLERFFFYRHLKTSQFAKVLSCFMFGCVCVYRIGRRPLNDLLDLLGRIFGALTKSIGLHMKLPHGWFTACWENFYQTIWRIGVIGFCFAYHLMIH